MPRRKKAKLTIELVPSTCWYSNVRTTLPTKEWDRLRRESYEKAGHKCEICGQTGKEQGYRHNVECHEIWYYDDENKIQKLMGLISLCPRCHQTKHLGRAYAIGIQDVVLAHMREVNGWSESETLKYITECFDKHAERSKHKWSLDISVLSDEHGVDKKLITEASKQREKEKKLIKGKKMRGKKTYKKKKSTTKKTTSKKTTTKKSTRRRRKL